MNNWPLSTICRFRPELMRTGRNVSLGNTEYFDTFVGMRIPDPNCAISRTSKDFLSKQRLVSMPPKARRSYSSNCTQYTLS